MKCSSRPFILLGSIASLCAVAAAHAGTIRDDVADSSYTALAALPEYAAVGKLTINAPGYFPGTGSGTLIADFWVLTAGHVVSFPYPSGVVFNLGVYYPLRNRTFLPVIIATIGASIFLSNSVLALYGPQPQVLSPWFDTQGLQVGPVYLDTQYLLILVVTLILVAFNFWFFEHTLLGKKLQATSQDKEMAALLGIPVATMIMLTFVYSALLAGVAGILVAPILFVSIQMGSTIALKAFAATIIGGFGDVKGAILGGLALGIIETFGAAYISVPYKDGFAFLVLVAFLIFRPQGIFGERVAEKA